MLYAHIFEGGESIDNSNIVEMDDWTEEDIRATFIQQLGDDWAADDTGDMFGVLDPIKMVDTIEMIGTNMAQAITDAEDGGMTYLVKAV